MLAHVNGAALFWITSKLAGLTTSGWLKVYSLMTALLAVVSLALVCIANMLF